MSVKYPRVLRDQPHLNPLQLTEQARLYAEEVSAGHYPNVQYDAENRWHQRLYRDSHFDIWLISWLPSQSTQLHDHGGSSGAFAVLSGDLDEAIYQDVRGRGVLQEHRRSAGEAFGFGPKHIHDVRNLSSEPAVSVHAYSPPLSSMNFFDVTDDGELQKLATLATNDPEPELDNVPGLQLVRAQRSAVAS